MPVPGGSVDTLRSFLNVRSDPDFVLVESERLKARLGEMLLKHELLEQKINGLEAGRPLARRRWKR